MFNRLRNPVHRSTLYDAILFHGDRFFSVLCYPGNGQNKHLNANRQINACSVKYTKLFNIFFILILLMQERLIIIRELNDRFTPLEASIRAAVRIATTPPLPLRQYRACAVSPAASKIAQRDWMGHFLF